MSSDMERGADTVAESLDEEDRQPAQTPSAAFRDTDADESARADDGSGEGSDNGTGGPGPSGARRSGSRELWKSVGSSAGVKVLVLPVSALLGIVNVRLIIDSFGRDAFAQYGLLVTIGALLPFADLGISAAVMNVVGRSKDPRHDPAVHAMLVSTIRVLIGSCTVLLATAATITALGAWRSILGDGLDPRTGPLAAALCLSTIAVSMLFGFSQRILAGVGKNHVSIGLLGLQTPIVLLTLIVIVRTGSPLGAYIAVVPYLAILLIQVLLTVLSAREVNPNLARAVRDVPRLRSVRGGRVFDVAWPMLIQMVAQPMALQTDRIVLSHLSSAQALAEYNLASQMFVPVGQVVSAAGFALWPIFAKEREQDGGASPVPISIRFGAAAAVITLVIGLASPLLARLASGGAITLPVVLVVVFATYMVFQALKYPLGIYMTDAKGLRYQAYMTVAMLPVNIGVSVLLAPVLGAAGPITGSLVGVALFHYAANLWYIRRMRRRAALVAAA